MLKLKVSNEDQYDDLEDQKRSLHARLIEERGKQRQMDDLISLSGMSLYSENGLMLNQVAFNSFKRKEIVFAFVYNYDSSHRQCTDFILIIIE